MRNPLISILLVYTTIFLLSPSSLEAQVSKDKISVTMYALEEGENEVNLLELESKPVIGEFQLGKFDIPQQDSALGIPGLVYRADWFGLAATGRMYFNESRLYRFATISDDGSLLYIDDTLVVDNGGIHGMESKTGQIYLEEGFHEVKILYYQGPPTGLGFQLEIEEEGQFVIWEFWKYIRPFVMQGKIINKRTGNPQKAEVKLTIFDNPDRDKLKWSDPVKGTFSFGMPYKGWYTLDISAPGFRPQTITRPINNKLIDPRTISLQPYIFTLKGKVLDEDTGKPVPSAMVIIQTPGQYPERYTTASDERGNYSIRIQADSYYDIKSHTKGYMFYNSRMEFDESRYEDQLVIKTNIILRELKPNENFILTAVTFDANKYDLKKISIPTLDDLALLLRENPHIRLLIKGHISVDIGGKMDMMKLSRNRAGSVRKYLLSKGIARYRLEIEGYGATQPIADNSTEDGRKKNQRVEFEIIK